MAQEPDREGERDKSTRPLPLLTFLCPTCKAAYRAIPGSCITCTHGGRPERLRPAALCAVTDQLTLTQGAES